VKLFSPSGSQVGGTTVFTSSAGKDANWSSLPATGTYTIFVDPGGYTGSVTLTLSDDLTDTISVGGSSNTVTISRAGQNERLTFSGTAGENLGLGMTSSSIASGKVYLYRSNGTQVGGTGIFVSTSGEDINWSNLPATDTYTLFVDPSTYTGSVTLTLSDDQTASVAPDGGLVAFSVGRLGQNERVSFRGASGQSLDLYVLGSTFPTATVTVSNPDGSQASHSVIAGSANLITFSVGGTGVSTIFYDPGVGTGSAELLLVPSGDAPASGASFTTCGEVPVFRAEPVSGSGVSYEFQVASDSGFSSVVADSGARTATNTFVPAPGTLSNGQTYYWRWKTGTGSWSSGRSFTLSQSHLGNDGSPLWSYGRVAVNEVSGNLIVSLPGPRYPTAVGAMGASVSYNSQQASDQGLGAGWLLDSGGAANAPVQLLDHNLWTGNLRADVVEALFSDGSSSCFTHVGQTNTYTSGPGDGSLLTRNVDGSWTYTSGDTIASFTAADGETGSAQLKSVESESAIAGQGTLSYAFSSADPSKVTSIEDESGRTVTFTWHSLDSSGCASAIVCVSGPDGVSWQYIGDSGGGSSGRLAQINDGTRTIAAISYDGSGRLQTLQNADDLDPTHASSGYNSSHSLVVSYDGSGRVSSVADGPISDQTDSTSTWSFAYNPGSVSTSATRASHGTLAAGTVRTAAGYTTITPPNQQGAGSPKLVKVFYDGHGNLLERDDTLGNVTEAGYDNQDELLWSEDADGNPTDYSWDTLNNVPLSVTGPDPGSGRPVTSYRYDETTIGTSTTSGTPLEGLQGDYYSNINLAGRPTLRQTDSSVDFNWGSGGPSGLGATDNFSVRWTGTITLPTSGAYTFTVRSDEGARLVVGGTVAIDNWVDQTVTDVSSPAISYSAGSYKLELDYYEHTGPAEVHLRWSCASCSPAISDQIIPASALQPAWENQTSTVSPSGRIAFSHYADPASGLPDYSLVKLADGTKLISSYSYDSHGRITEKVEPKGNASATIDSNGNLSGSPDSHYITSYSYYGTSDTAAPPAACGGGSAVNQAGQLETRSVAGLADQTSVYDAAGRLIAFTDGAGTSCYSYDAEGRLTSEKAPGDSQATTFSYDPAGLTLSATNAAGTASYSYDEAGRLKDSLDINGAETSYAYDDNGNLLTRVAASGALSSSTNYTTSYSYDAADQLTGLTDPASNTYSFFYDSRGNLKATQYPNGTFSWNDINPLGELTALYNRHDSTPLSAPLPSSVPADSSGSALVDYSYSYTPDGQISEEIRSGGGLTSKTTDYSYDNLGRLDQVVLPDGSCRDYSYDLDSNRTQIKQASSGCGGSFTTTASYTYDPATTPGLDALTTQTGPSRSFSYNTDGAMTGRGSDSLSWDGWGRNTGGTYSATTISYSYDPAGNQASRNSGSQTTNFLYGGSQNPIFETDSSGTITLSYIQGPGGDLAHYAGPPTTSSTLSYLYPNGHGDLAATADTSGNRTNNYTYDPFGSPNETVPSNTTTQRWTGSYDKQLDTTSNLIQMGARPYDPTLGRFTTTDPIDSGSLNPYDYAGQDPINNYDLDGNSVCGFVHCHAVTGGLIKLAPIAAGTVVGGVSGVFCGACGVYLGGAAVGITSGLIAKYHDHASTSRAVQAGLTDAVISFVTEGAVRQFEAGAESAETVHRARASGVRVLRIKPHTTAWVRYHHGG
jgi:RHS repeat-associated protein